jgi:hypothetical protein
MESNSSGTIPESIEVIIQKDKYIVMESQCLPNAVSD